MSHAERWWVWACWGMSCLGGMLLPPPDGWARWGEEPPRRVDVASARPRG